jgi:hypothetical protein
MPRRASKPEESTDKVPVKANERVWVVKVTARVEAASQEAAEQKVIDLVSAQGWYRRVRAEGTAEQ